MVYNTSFVKFCYGWVKKVELGRYSLVCAKQNAIMPCSFSKHFGAVVEKKICSCALLLNFYRAMLRRARYCRAGRLSARLSVM